MKMKRIIISAVILTTLNLPLTAANGKPQGACKADIEKFCGSHKGNRQAMRACIKQNKENFSAECKAPKQKPGANRAEHRAKRAKSLEACSGDVQKYCPEANQPGAKKNAPFRCLMLNRDKLSPACQAALPEKRVRKEK